MTRLRCFIGFDAAQIRAWNVAQMSLRKVCAVSPEIEAVTLSNLQHRQVYTRPTRHLEQGYWDEISGAPMSTGHAIARFFVPQLCRFKGLALFTDGDVLFRHDLSQLLAIADLSKAISVVKHDFVPTATVKMTGQAQTVYPRKNWSSVILWNCAHAAHRALPELVNTVPGRDLHRFCWLKDEEIGALPAGWNHLVGHSAADLDPAIVHFTDGTPDMPGYEHSEWSDDWYRQARACGYRLHRPQKPEAA